MNPQTLKTILILLFLAASALAGPLGGITISKNKQNPSVAAWKGRPKGKAGEARPLDEHVAAQFGVEGFAALAKMPRLRVLYVQHAHTAVKDAAMLLRSSKHLEGFTSGTVFCDELLEAAAQAPSLKKFAFGDWGNIPKDASPTPEGYTYLVQTKKLETLSAGIRARFLRADDYRRRWKAAAHHLELRCASEPRPRGGKVFWPEPFDIGYEMATVPHDDRCFVFNEKGDLLIGRLTPVGFEEISRTHLLDPDDTLPVRPVTWAHTAFAHRNVYARSDSEIIAFSLAAENQKTRP